MHKPLTKEAREAIRNLARRVVDGVEEGHVARILAEGIRLLLADLDAMELALRWIRTYVKNQPLDSLAEFVILDKVDEALGEKYLRRATEAKGE